jgi:hypothetical protein
LSNEGGGGRLENRLYGASGCFFEKEKRGSTTPIYCGASF